MSARLHCLLDSPRQAHDHLDALAFDAPGTASVAARLAGVLLGTGGEERAARLLESGVARVFVGDAALTDPGVLGRLARRFGAGRVGFYALARRASNQWAFEPVSNADFKVVAPSVGEPAWEVLRHDGSLAGPTAHRGVEQMLRHGVRQAVVQVDIRDDADLNLCAGLVEMLGDDVCFAPAQDEAPRLDEWVRFGHVRRIALAPALYRRREALLTPADDAQDG